MGKISKHVCLALGVLALLASCGAESSSAPPVFSSTSKADTSSVPSSSASSSASSESSAGTSASSSPAEDVGLKEAYETYVKNAREKGENPMSYEEWLAFIKGEKGKSFTVTFDLGYEGKSFTQKVEEGKTAEKPEDPLRNGYNFLDWVDVNGDHWVFNGYPITRDITLYAKWSEPIEYTVTFVNNGGTVLDVQTGHYGDTLVYGGATPVAENQDAHYIYTFSGWDGDLVITGDATLTATYEMAYIATTAYYYDYDGTTLLASVPLAEGEEPHYDGATPTRERDKANKIQFEFEGWDKAEETADSVKFVARYASCTDGLDIEGDTVTYYHGTSTNVVIPSTWGGVKITKIGNGCFSGSGVASVTISSGVTSIGELAFQRCSSLSSIVIPESVASIGDSAFYGCSSLSSIVIPESVASIGGWAFYGCSSLSSIVIPESVAFIDNYAFEGCSSLSSVVIPESVASIGYGAFRNCPSLSSIVIPESVAFIGDSAFSGCSSLSSVTIPSSVASIGNGAFYGCPSLVICCESEYKPFKWDSNWSGGCPVIWGYRSSSSTDAFEYVISEIDGDAYATITGFLGTPTEVVVPSTVEGLPVKLSALSLSPLKDGLESIEIQDGVELLGDLSFQSFPKLETVALPDTLKTIGGWAFYGCSSLSSIVIPESVTSIDNYAFDGCSSLSSISIPDGVASIGEGAFYGCSSLSSIVIPESVTSIGVWAFEGCASLASIAIPDGVASIKNYTFEGCSSLVSVVIPENVTSIGEGAFHDCPSLTSVTIPSSVTSIGGSAFRDCPSLASIVIPESVTSVGVWVFYNCPSLAIYCRADSKPSGWDDEWNPDNRPVVWGYRSSSSTDAFEYDVCEIGGDAYATITGFLGTPTEVVVPSTVEGLPVKLSAHSLSPLKDGLESIEIQDGIEVLGDLSFQSFPKLETVALPDTLKTIGEYAFYDCPSLTSVTIPSSVTSIGGSAFRNCPSLASIVIPDSVTSIGNSAFLGCSSLTIYCEADSKPSGWNYYWNPDNRPVVWDYRG